MTALDWMTLGVSVAAGYGCLCRIFAVSWTTHRPSIVGGLVLLASVSILAGSQAAQGRADPAALLAVSAVSLYLLATLPEWRHGAPESIRRRA